MIRLIGHILYHAAKQRSHRCSESSVSRLLAEQQARAAVTEYSGSTVRISCLSHYVCISLFPVPFCQSFMPFMITNFFLGFVVVDCWENDYPD